MSQILDTDLHGRLESVQRLERRRRWGTAVSVSALAILGLAAILVLLDYRGELPVAWRGAGLVLMLGAAGWLLHEARRRSRYAASDVEAAYPRYGQRLRTTLDYQDRPLEVAPAAPSLLVALERETRQITAADDFTQAHSPRRFYLATGGLLLAVIFCGAALLAAPELRIAAGRLLLLPLDYTTVSVEPVASPLRQGADAVIEAEIQGRPLSAAAVLYRKADSQDPWQQQALLPAGTDPEQPLEAIAGRVAAAISDCQHDLEILVVAGPRPHPLQRIAVLLPLDLQSFAAHVEPPAYTGRSSEDITSQSFTVWEGSRVQLRFQLNRPPARARLEFPSGAAGIDLTIRDSVATADLTDVRQSLRFALQAAAGDGMTLDSPTFHVRVQLDRKPEVRFTSPEEHLEVIPTTEVPLAIEASDDLGLTRVGVLYQIGDQPAQTLWEQTPETATPALHAENKLFLEDHPLDFRDAVTYYAFAEDNYFGQPRRVTSELRFIDIRPFKREYQILQAPGGT